MTMTREEARRTLRDYVLSAYVTDAEREALDVAIAALSAQEPVIAGYMAFGKYDGRAIALPHHSGRTVSDVAHSLMQAATREGFRGSIAERLSELDWTIEPVYAAPPAQADTKQAEPMSPWLPIETAPRDGTDFLVAIHVHNIKTNKSHWEINLVAVDDETGCITSDTYTGWDLQDYSHWQPLPVPPALHQLGANVEVSDG